MIFALMFGGFGQAQAQGQTALPKQNALAAPAAVTFTETDVTKVPHYFGPFPNYANSPQTVPNAIVAIAPPVAGTTATANAIVNPVDGSISGFTITNPGGGYTVAPLVSITGLGTLAAATAVVDPTGIVNSITPDVGGAGSGYTAPSVAITGGGATTDATATATGGVDALINITNGGTGFTQQPMVTFSLPNDPAGIQATGSATMNLLGVVDSITVVEPGSGYTSAPDVTITDGIGPIFGNGTGATATATLHITGFTMNTFGTGYTSAPLVTISDDILLGGIGLGATATPTMTYGSITGFTITNPGSGYLTPGIKKFVDTLPGLGAAGANNLGNYISIAVADTTTYPGTDYYEIAVVQYRQRMSSSLPGQGTLLRGYVQLSTAVVPGAHVQLTNANLDPNIAPTDIVGYFGVDSPRYLGATIVAQRDRPVRILFRDLLPTGVAGDLFLPVDTTVMGSGPGPLASMAAPLNNGTVVDEIRNPICNAGFNAAAPNECYTQNRATLHLHGGITPWISDGTPHQWITPAGENTSYPQGVSVSNVPDMPDPGPGAQTFFYTNQQSARLMFYHDHSWGITRLNVYAGEAAGYVLTDSTEAALMAGPLKSVGLGIPLIIQDKTFVPSPTELARQDPTWNAALWGGEGNLWLPHVMMPAQNPGSSTGQSNFGRWMYGPWFWPPASPKYGPIANPYFDPFCDPNLILADGSNQFCEPPLIPGVPNLSVGMEAFNDTPIVNGVAYPTVTLDPKPYRFRILNAANDRFMNLQWYVADSATASTGLNALGQPIGGTEVALNAAEVAAAQTNPDISPTPNTLASPVGPNWVQIGTEGGFLPTPTVVSGSQITTFITNPTRFDVGNVDKHSLLLGTAERGDVIVDFSKYSGKTLILYNDAPAAFPARVANYDYYTGGPDLTGSGGAPTTLAGYGPNTRTIMQVKIAAKPAAAAFNMVPLNAAFAHHNDAAGKPAGVFESSQDPIIVGQAAYNTAYGTAFRSAAPNDGFARINDMSLTFNTLLTGGTPTATPLNTLTIPFENKGMHDEMNSAVFDEFGRMSANLGLEAPGATPLTQNIILYPYINPTSEFMTGIELPYGASGTLKAAKISSAADGTEIWKITHNGVDTHPIHFHLFNVQILNRITWDNIIIKPEASELGWKDTIRVSPLEDTIIALRPIVPKSPFGLWDSIRPLNPAMPIGDKSGFNNTDFKGNPLTGVNIISNQMTNFGWEYVWHCHILGHEEMDMMRPIKVDVSRAMPAAPVLSSTGSSGGKVNLSWTDGTPIDYNALNPASWGDPSAEIGYRVERSDHGANVFATTWKALANQTSLPDATTNQFNSYDYRVVVYNVAGEATSNVITVDPAPLGAPTFLVATAFSSNQINLTWVNNASTQIGFTVERAPVTAGIPGAFVTIGTVPSLDPLGATIAFSDGTPPLTPKTTYAYQVNAYNAIVGPSSNVATATTFDLAPTAPTALTASVFSTTQVNLAWTDTSSNETNFVLERAVNGAAFAVLATLPANTKTYNDTAVAAGNDYAYQVKAINLGGSSPYSNTASVSIIAAPIALTATAVSASQVNLTWSDTSTNETGFSIERCAGASCTTFLQVGTVAANVANYSDMTTAPVTTYVYQVIATNLLGVSKPSSTATVTTLDVPPAAPTALSALLVNGPQVALTWTDNATNETGMVVESSLNGAAFTVIATLPANTVSYTDLTVIGGNTYVYQVKATNSGGSSAYSNTATMIVPIPPAAPTVLTATLLGNPTSVQLRWTDNATTETGFVVERCAGVGCTTFALITTVAARNGTGNVTFTDGTVLLGTSYSYRVFAINAGGSSLPSNVATLTIGSLPAAPTALTYTLGTNPLRVRLTWFDNAIDETNFVLERSINGGAFTTLATVGALQGTGTRNYTDGTVLAGNTYAYRVKAVNLVGSSAYSNVLSVSLLLPAAPSSANASAILVGTSDRVTLTWVDNANNETSFTIQRATNATFTAGLGNTSVAANATTFGSTVNRGRTYYYRIQTVNAIGVSAWVNFTPFPIVTP
ncbi:MAG: multicopper oxidase domain-containing protein [Chloroflexi bacterium]|nr:multicopper oxidase domain-containing protein [Chloroflexota bacterium]